MRYSLWSSLIGEAMVFENTNSVRDRKQTYIYGLGKRIAVSNEHTDSLVPTYLYKYIEFEFDTAFRQNSIKSQYQTSSPDNQGANGTARLTYLSTQGLNMSSISPGGDGRGAGVEEKWNTTGFSNASGSCTLDGTYIPCEWSYRLIGYEGNGGAVQCPFNNCGPQRFVYHGLDGETPFLSTGVRAHADGAFSHGVPADVQRIIGVDLLRQSIRNGALGQVINFFDGNGGGQDCPKGTKPQKDAQGKVQCVGVGVVEVTVKDEPQNVDPLDFSNFQAALNQAVNLINLVSRRVKLIGFNEGQQSAILNRLFPLVFDQGCVNAFKAAKITTPAEVIRDRGLVFAHFDALKSSANNGTLGITEGERIYIRGNKNDIRKGGFTPNPAEKPGPVITFFYDWSFKGQPYSFDESFVHESIHGSNVGSQPYYFLGLIPIGHDLSGYEHYQNILDSCRTR